MTIIDNFIIYPILLNAILKFLATLFLGNIFLNTLLVCSFFDLFESQLM